MFLIAGCSTGEAISDAELEQAILELSAEEQAAVFAADTALAGQAIKLSLSKSKEVAKLRQELNKKPIEFQNELKKKVSGCLDSDYNLITDIYHDDLGNSIYKKGTVTWNGESYVDGCVNSQLIENYCYLQADRGQIVAGARPIDIPSGYICDDGALIVNANTCTDSDGGSAQPAFVKGTAANEITERTDECSSNTLIEFSCASSGLIDRTLLECNNFGGNYICYNGACVQYSCTDTDATAELPNGNNIYKKGQITWTTTNAGFGANDVCKSGQQIIDDYAEDDEVPPVDIDSSKNYLLENYCGDDGHPGLDFVICDNGCVDGACVAECTDSDGGDIYNKGTVVGLDLNGRVITVNDYCAQTDTGEETESGLYVVEEQCLDDGGVVGHYYLCPSGTTCQDGACVESYFVDPNLEAAIREAINKPEGEITEEDFLDNNCLNLNNKGITNLMGLERFTGITCLLLNENQITDLSPLSSLTNLQRLELLSNRITDISHLSGLINLNYLGLGDNQIADISSLSGLINLQALYLNHNKITDISHLLRLNYLEVLWLGENYLDTGDCNNINTLKERGVTFDPNTQDINDLLAECALT